jgi:hypothetical protein
MALKGAQAEQDLAVLPFSVKVFHVEQLVVRGLNVEGV